MVNTLTLEENESLSLDVWSVRDFELAVQRGLSGDVVVGYQNADDHLIRGILQAIDVDTRIGQRITPRTEKKSREFKTRI